jgi:acetyl-CoA synthetase
MNDQYQALHQTFRWLVPAQFNIAQSCCHQWAATPAHARSIAIFYEDEDSQREVWTYGRLAEAVNQLANGLVKLGVAPGDRVAVAMGQRPETVVAYMAIYTVGAVSLPLSTQLGSDAMEIRLRDSGAQVAVIDPSSSPALLAAADRCPHLQQIVGVDLANERILPWRSLLARQPASFKPVATRAGDPAILLYPAGAASALKGVLLPHSALIGSLPGFVASQDWFPKHGDVFWSPADWARTDGLMDALLPTLYFGHSIVGTPGHFSPERAFDLMQRYQITNTCLSPAALMALMQSAPSPHEHYKLALRAMTSTGEDLAETVRDWCQAALGLAPNAMFGRTEANYVVGDSGKRWPARPGSMGRPYPGHRVAVIDEQGRACPAGEVGELAVNRYDIHGHPDPALFLGYWSNETATRDKFSGDWCRTGELARVDADGYLWHAGRADDAIKSTYEQLARITQHPDISR